jgi:NAD+ synthase (glutamine-hydrolysing)
MQNLTQGFIFPGFDLRPFLYPSRFPFQFAKIDAAVEELPDLSQSTIQPETGKAKVD